MIARSCSIASLFFLKTSLFPAKNRETGEKTGRPGNAQQLGLGSGQAAFVAPPRTIADITAILDSEKPNEAASVLAGIIGRL